MYLLYFWLIGLTLEATEPFKLLCIEEDLCYQIKGLCYQGQSPTTKVSPVETNPENTNSHKVPHISSSRDDKSNL